MGVGLRQPTTTTHTHNCAMVALQKLWLYAPDVTRQLRPRGSSLPVYPISQPSGSRIPSVAFGGFTTANRVVPRVLHLDPSNNRYCVSSTTFAGYVEVSMPSWHQHCFLQLINCLILAIWSVYSLM